MRALATMLELTDAASPGRFPKEIPWRAKEIPGRALKQLNHPPDSEKSSHSNLSVNCLAFPMSIASVMIAFLACIVENHKRSLQDAEFGFSSSLSLRLVEVDCCPVAFSLLNVARRSSFNPDFPVAQEKLSN